MGSNLTFSILIVFLFNSSVYGVPVVEDLYEGSNCKLEDGKAGVCKKIQDCPSKLEEVLEGKRSSDSVGRCGFQGFTEIVCCHVNVTGKIGLRPAEIACRQYENEIGSKAKKVEFHIFGGTEAERGEFPYMVALGYEGEDEESNSTNVIKYSCGGTLISSQHVLTAAHCVRNVQDKIPIEVRVGSEDLKNAEEAQRIPISDVIPHPRYKRSMNYNDVAILKLRTPVNVASNVRPICIQTKSLITTNIPSAVSFIVIGWGATSFDDDHSTKLMKTPGLGFIDKETCGKSFQGFNKLPHGLDDNMLCVLDNNVTRRSDTCHGDSGGPLLMLTGPNHSIVGVTAFGQTCGGSIPGIYTAVYSYLEWIEKQVWPEMIDE